MAKEITITIDNRSVRCPEGTFILEAADQAGVYIPRLCYHPELSPGPGTKADGSIYRCGKAGIGDHSSDGIYGGCNICIVEIEGTGLSRSCTTPGEDGMVIHSDAAPVREARRTNLALILSRHPHACMLCAQKAGCDRDGCTGGVEKHGRCCLKFNDCEFRKVCEYVTVKENVSQYIFRDIPVTDTALFTSDPNLCIGCTRCVRACEKMQGKRIVGFTFQNGEFLLGTVGPSHKESGCTFCGACVAVCPTGALMDKGLPWKKKTGLHFASVTLPPEGDLALNEENINKAPEANGVFQLVDDNHEVILIRGADNIRKGLQEILQSGGKARFFRYEEHGMYTMRENEMLEKYLKKHGTLPEVNNEISDLY